MAEGLGVVASIIAIIQLTAKVTSLGYDYIGGAKRAPDELRGLVDELTSLGKVLAILEKHADKNRQWTALETLNDHDGPIRRCGLDLRRLQLKLDPGDGLRGMMNNLKWPFKEKETLQEISRIERHKTLFMFALNTDQISLSKAIETYVFEIKTDLIETKTDVLETKGSVLEIKGDVLKIKADVLETKTGVQDTSIAIQDLQTDFTAQRRREQKEDAARDAKKRVEVLDWIYSGVPDKQHIEIRNRRQKDTGKWLLLTPEITMWVKRHPNYRLLWGYGIPGAGKTFLSSTVIDFLREQAPAENYGVAHIYFNYKEQKQQRPIDVLASFVKQLAFQLKDLPQEIRNLHIKCTEAGERPTFEELYTVLITTHKSYAQTFFVCDALDECDQRSQRRELLSLFHCMGENGMSVFMTSRQHPEDIQDSFRKSAKIELQAKEEDMRRYIEQKINDNPRAKRLVRQGKCQDKIIAELTGCAKGMFLLVHFHIEYLCQQATVQQILSELEKLKNSSIEDRPLDPTYDRVMEALRMQPRNCAELALKILSWLVKAQRRLTFEELQMAVSIEPDRYELDELDLPDKATLLDVCAGLVMIDDRNTVQLAHYTVQEYLLRNSVVTDDANSLLGVACITFLAFDAFTMPFESPDPRLKKYPFLNYSTAHWKFHLERCGEALSMLPFLKFLARPGNRRFCLDYLRVNSYYWARPQLKVLEPPLHLASSIGHHTVARLLLKRIEFSVPGSHGWKILHLARSHGHKEVVQLLWGKTDILAVHNGHTALYLAASGGHTELVQLLLDEEVNILSVLEHYQLAFLEAASRGHEPVVRLLLDRGGISLVNGGEVLALHNAVLRGALGMVQLLLDKGADISVPDKLGNTALCQAARQRNGEILQLLLGNGADPSVRNNSGRTALHIAVSQRVVSSDIVQLLLNQGANPSVPDNSGETALHITMRQDIVPRDIVQLLLDNGADPSVPNNIGQTALHIAAMYQVWEEILHLLIQGGADLSAQDIFGYTTLHIAASQGHKQILQVLLDQGTNISVQDKSGQTALHKAVLRGDQDIIKLLLDKGADLPIQDTSGRTALHEAVRHGNRCIAQPLLDKGADPLVQDYYGQTALHIASSLGHEETVQLLLSNESGLDVQDSFGLTALHIAAAQGNTSMYQLLLNHGADPSLQDHSSQTASDLAEFRSRSRGSSRFKSRRIM